MNKIEKSQTITTAMLDEVLNMNFQAKDKIKEKETADLLDEVISSNFKKEEEIPIIHTPKAEDV